ncbi:hypothetical protein ARMGADRAFT_1035698 [Armillaria gallica]|uniref:Uncharacterized protein n=1 Tax=Armillaria gallica TaxID=47427 RepID=A0A2H3CXP0_ARMGA|nr:hypothetical protein ARMGADRAFT_1035698 [Armillaria gallica]
MLLYLQNQYSYDTSIDESRPLAVMKWFEGLIDDLNGQLLLHSQLKVLTMTVVTQIRQYYTNQHNAWICEEKGKKAANIKFSTIQTPVNFSLRQIWLCMMTMMSSDLLWLQALLERMITIPLILIDVVNHTDLNLKGLKFMLTTVRTLSTVVKDGDQMETRPKMK